MSDGLLLTASWSGSEGSWLLEQYGSQPWLAPADCSRCCAVGCERRLGYVAGLVASLRVVGYDMILRLARD